MKKVDYLRWEKETLNAHYLKSKISVDDDGGERVFFWRFLFVRMGMLQYKII